MDEKISIMESLKILTESIKAWANKNKVDKDVVGDLSTLETQEKTDIVSAINEAAKAGGFVAQSEPPENKILLWIDTDDETETITNEKDPTVFDWAKQELFNKIDLIDSAERNSFLTIDDVEYYRYHASDQNFEWANPKPFTGSVTITFRVVNQYSASSMTKLVAYYEDGTTEYIFPTDSVIGTFTTNSEKIFTKLTGNYDAENWFLLDLSVMSIKANYNIGLPLANEEVAGGVVADPAESSDTQPVRIGADGKLYTSSLPSVTTADNGKVLMVVDGAWAVVDLNLSADTDGVLQI